LTRRQNNNLAPKLRKVAHAWLRLTTAMTTIPEEYEYQQHYNQIPTANLSEWSLKAFRSSRHVKLAYKYECWEPSVMLLNIRRNLTDLHKEINTFLSVRVLVLSLKS
jgi:hypothetical protein